MSQARSFSGVALHGLLKRKFADHSGPLARGRRETHVAAMQFDKGAHQRQAESGAAMPRALRMALEHVEGLVAELRRHARAGVGHGEDHATFGPSGADAYGRILRREADGV